MGQEDFLKALSKDPGLIGKLGKQEDLRSFKDKFGVEKASGLKCPACAAFFQYPGSLWYRPINPIHFVCRKCKLEFRIDSLTVPNLELIEEVKRISKGKGGFPSWLKSQAGLYDPNKYDYLKEEE